MQPDLSLYGLQYHLMIQKDIISVINGFDDEFIGRVLARISNPSKTEI